MIIKRKFLPGEMWVYYKLYTSEIYADKILVDYVSKLIDKLYKKKVINKFFFIRYNDPEFHLRLRFELSSSELFFELINEVNIYFNFLIKNGLIYDISINAYSREIERYKPIPIAVVESFFSINTLFCLSIIKQSQNDENIIWLSGLKWIDDFLSSLKLNYINKLHIVSSFRDSFSDEFNTDKFFSKSLNIKYQKDRNVIFDLLDGNENFKYYSIIDLSKKSIEINFNNIVILNKYISKNSLMKNSNSIIFGLIHMFINRLFRSKNRFHEFVIYDFLKRYYTMKVSIDKKYLSKI